MAHRDCPFCQHGELQARKVELLDDDYKAVVCLNCLARGPVAVNDESAWRLWESSELRHVYDAVEGVSVCVCSEVEPVRLPPPRG